VIGSGQVFYHLAEGAHALEFTISWGKPEFVGGHSIDSRCDLVFSNFERGLQCVPFLPRVERYIVCINGFATSLHQNVGCR
jgi:hypothetical protein